MREPGQKVSPCHTLPSCSGVYTYTAAHRSLVTQISRHPADELNLLIHRQACDGCLQDVAKSDLVNGNEGVVVHEREKAHDELAIHTVRHASMAGDRITEILDLEGTLETRGEESTEGSDQ